MNYRCKACGGSMVYSAKRKKMFCPHCGQTDTEIIEGNDSLENCPFCGAPFELGEFDSSSECPYCNNYIIYDKRVSEEYEPDYIIPFQIDQEDAIAAMESAFQKRLFIPSAFWDEKRLKGMKGHYVPFFLYDFGAEAHYVGEGRKTRSWTSGNYRYTEVSRYQIVRHMTASYQRVPADASIQMPDATMDLLEPYTYHQMREFDPKYMSGFYGEVYNYPSEAYVERARRKAMDSAKELLNRSVTGYSSYTPVQEKDFTIEDQECKYGLLPVWLYRFEWLGQNYSVYVNGQTFKVVGDTPISKAKVWLYAASYGFITFAILEMVIMMLQLL